MECYQKIRSVDVRFLLQNIAQTGFVDDLLEDDSPASNKTLRLLSEHVDFGDADIDVAEIKDAAKQVLHDFPNYDASRLRNDIAQAQVCIENLCECYQRVA